MSKESSRNLRKKEAKAFVEQHWPLATASTIVGASILLLIWYHRHRKGVEGSTEPENPELPLHEDDAKNANLPNAVLFFETGLPVVESIENAAQLTKELAEEVETEEAKNWLLSLGRLRR